MSPRQRCVRTARRNAGAVAGAAAGLLCLAWLGLGDFAFNDYDSEASAAVHALTAGHLGRFLALAPAYGGSLALRSPFAFAPGVWGGGELAVYRMLALPCLLAAGVLAVWLAARMRDLGRPALARAVAVGLLAANPVMLFALQIGHAEEILGASLCVAALVLARSGRATWAGLLLGLAVANKSWALVAVAPVLCALPAQRGRAALIAAAAAGAVLAPFAVAHQLQPDGGAAGALSSGSGPIFEPAQLWWWLGSHGVVRGANGLVKAGYRLQPHWLGSLAHPLIVVLAVPLSLLWVRRRRAEPLSPLGLLTFLLALRCLLDPWNNLYYATPFLFALATWESLEQREGALLALAASGLAWVTFQQLPGRVSPDAQSAFYLAWMLPLTVTVAARAYAPSLCTHLLARAALGRGGIAGFGLSRPRSAPSGSR